MKKYNDYLDELLFHLQDLRSKNRKYLYRIQDEVSDKYIPLIHKYFENSTEYKIIETRKCIQCRSNWDIIIEILY